MALLALALAASAAVGGRVSVPTGLADPASRAHALLAQMTLDEKIAMVHGNNTVGGSGSGYVGYIPAIARLNIPPVTMNDGPEGFRGPVAGTSVQWPSGVASAASWNVSMVREWGVAMGGEFARKGATVMFGPGVNVARVPVAGRLFEYLSGEEPYLGATLVVPMVEGIQSQGVIACAKHFDAQGEEEGRHTVSSNVDNRTLAEVYLPVFQAAARAGLLSVMCANNLVNGVHSCANGRLIHHGLEQVGGFQGMVLSDYQGTQSTVGSALGGLDVQMPGCVRPDDADPLRCLSDPVRPNYFGEPLKRAVLSGEVPQSVLDGMVFRVLYSVIAIGAFDSSPSGSATTNVTTEANVAMARRIAVQSSVLLTNRRSTLPLSAASFSASAKVAVIGPAAHDAPITGGGGSGEVKPAWISTVLDAVTRRVGSDAVTYYGGTDAATAAKVAASASAAIVVVASSSKEGSDRSNLTLGQTELAVAVAAAQASTVVVAVTPGPFLSPWEPAAAATLVAWLPGQQAGEAAASVLFGEAEPEGRLPFTLPTTEHQMPFTPQQYPGVNNSRDYTERLNIGYRWYQAHNETPAFPFGHGLSLAGESAFAIEGLSVDDIRRTVAAVITNTGSRPGVVVPQLYLGFPPGAGEPPLLLRGFTTLRLEAGESQAVQFQLTERDISTFSEQEDGWKLFKGEYDVRVGQSSASLPIRSVLQVL